MWQYISFLDVRLFINGVMTFTSCCERDQASLSMISIDYIVPIKKNIRV